LADEKTKEAQAHLFKAQAEEEKSRLAYEGLQRAMDDIRKKNRTTFESFAALGVELITRTEHEDALKKIAVALEVEVEESLKESGLRLLLEELLYFFAEGNRRPGLARSAAAMLLRIEPAGRKRELLVRCVEELWTDRGQFGILLRELSGYDHFQRRYYPVFVGIVPSGSTVRYEMGSSPDEWGDQPEELKHQVELGSYDMSETTVTFYHYSLYCESTGRGLASRTPYWGRYGDHPVVNVSWYDTVEYCIWLNGQREMQSPYQLRQAKGSDIHNEVRSDYLKWLVEWDFNVRGYRLPTEAEWEYAARGGAKTEGTMFSGSNEVGEVGWYWKNSGDNELPDNWSINRILDNNCRSHPVGEKKSNESGLYDMSGNVFEWCWDWYDSSYYKTCLESGISRNPVGPVSGKDGRVLRGGSWRSTSGRCRVTFRNCNYSNNRFNYVGFRLVLVP
jgi:formylglycine-generating enzyme required for sulfatase activity